MAGRQLKLHSLIRVRVSRPLEVQLLQWSARAGLSESDFLRMALVNGGRDLALRWNLYRPSDDLDLDEIEGFRFRGAERPKELGNGSEHYTLNITGELPSDDDFEASMTSRKARLERKKR